MRSVSLILTHVLRLLTARPRRNPPRRWRIHLAFWTKLFGLLAAFFGMLRVILELWNQLG